MLNNCDPCLCYSFSGFGAGASPSSSFPMASTLTAPNAVCLCGWLTDLHLTQPPSELHSKICPCGYLTGISNVIRPILSSWFSTPHPHPRIPTCPFLGVFQLLLETSQKKHFTPLLSLQLPSLIKSVFKYLSNLSNSLHLSSPPSSKLSIIISSMNSLLTALLPTGSLQLFSTLQPEWPFKTWMAWCHSCLKPFNGFPLLIQENPNS